MKYLIVLLIVVSVQSVAQSVAQSVQITCYLPSKEIYYQAKIVSWDTSIHAHTLNIRTTDGENVLLWNNCVIKKVDETT